jgi:hypothetical protein
MVQSWGAGECPTTNFVPDDTYGHPPPPLPPPHPPTPSLHSPFRSHPAPSKSHRPSVSSWKTQSRLRLKDCGRTSFQRGSRACTPSPTSAFFYATSALDKITINNFLFSKDHLPTAPPPATPPAPPPENTP